MNYEYQAVEELVNIAKALDRVGDAIGAIHSDVYSARKRAPTPEQRAEALRVERWHATRDRVLAALLANRETQIALKGDLGANVRAATEAADAIHGPVREQ